MELGHIQIFFGKVKSVDDENKICCCQIAIPGLTDEIPTDKLPWYYPWYGREYLPLVDDTVAVLVFDNNFSTAFYGRKIDLVDAGVSEGDYPNYLEIFKRKCGNALIQLTYKESTGIEFINGSENGSNGTKTHMELDKYTLWCDGNSITMTKDAIDIGNKALEKVCQGDKTVKHLHNIIKHQANIITQMYMGFQKIIAGCTNPYTASIASQLSGHLPTQANLTVENKSCDSEADTIQSKMVSTAG